MTSDKIRIAVAEARGWNKKSQFIPDYPIDLNACHTLIAHLCHQGWTCTMNNGLDTTWECEFQRTKPDAHVYAAADTLPLAICQGFLRVEGKWPEE